MMEESDGLYNLARMQILNRQYDKAIATTDKLVSVDPSNPDNYKLYVIAYASGGNFTFLQLVMGYMVARVVIVAIFLPAYFRGELFTAYQLIDRRFGKVLHRFTAGIFLVTRAVAEGVRVFAVCQIVVEIEPSLADASPGVLRSVAEERLQFLFKIAAVQTRHGGRAVDVNVCCHSSPSGSSA